MFLVDGETLDSPNTVRTETLRILKLRNLDLEREALLAKPARPETIADLRSTDFAARVVAQKSIEPVNLRGRGLRGANLRDALMPMAVLEGAQLQRAVLRDAQLQGANLRGCAVAGRGFGSGAVAARGFGSRAVAGREFATPRST
jgi:uncharacterized protein YjbI with pentapeptide repeats